MEEGSDTSQTGWREEMVEEGRVCVTECLCQSEWGVDQGWVMEAEGDASFECSS